MINSYYLLCILIVIISFTTTEKYKSSKFYGYISPYRGIMLIILGICIAIYAILKMPPFPALVIPVIFILIGIIDMIKIRKTH
jgi:uncharacterized membrane protein